MTTPPISRDQLRAMVHEALVGTPITVTELVNMTSEQVPDSLRDLWLMIKGCDL